MRRSAQILRFRPADDKASAARLAAITTATNLFAPPTRGARRSSSKRRSPRGKLTVQQLELPI
jgi:hypothetical protein